MATTDFNNFSGLSDPTFNGSQMGAQVFGASQNYLSGGNNQMSTGSALPSAQVSAPQVPGMNGGTGSGAGGGNFWSKDGGAGLILGGVQVLGNLWNSYQANKMAKKQMSFAREQWDTNLANQTQTYNTALEDRIRARHNTEGRASSETDSYLNEHRL